MAGDALKTTLADKATVLEAMPDHPALKGVLAWNAGALLDAKFDRGELTLTVARESLIATAETLRKAGYNAFQDMTAVDWYPASPRFQLSYHILSHTTKRSFGCVYAWMRQILPSSQ